MKLIIGNWKMYPQTLRKAKQIVARFKRAHMQNLQARKRTKVVICPPAPFIYPIAVLLGRTAIVMGAQNMFAFPEGAYTGEVSPTELKDIGASFVIIGHSERRALGEDDATIAKKVVAATRHKLSVILCIGETVRDEGGAYFTEVGRELRASLDGFPKKETKHLVIAYEPIWAIGTKAARAASPEDFREMSVFIRRNLVDKFGKKAGFAVPILYGGSVDDINAQGFLGEGGADGLLVGRASLDPKKFSAIVRTASETF